MDLKKLINKVKLIIKYRKVKGVSAYKSDELKIIKTIKSEDFIYPGFADVYGKVWFEKYTQQVPDSFVLSIPEGIFIAQEETVFTKSKKAVAEITSLHQNPMIGKRTKIKTTEYIDGVVADLGLDGLDSNYYHFNIEFLMRWWLLKLSGVEPDYYVCSSNAKFAGQFYKLIGLDEAKLLVREKGTIIRAKELIVPSLVNNWELIEWNGCRGCWKKYLPSWGNQVHKFILKQNNLIADKNERLVYISRNRSASRIIENEDALLNILGKYRFETYYLEDLTVLEQIKLFQSARVIVTPHGAGLVNTVYCKENVKVFEIFPAHYNDPSYRVQAAWLKTDYHYMITAANNVKGEADIPQHENIYIDDLEKVEETIRKLL